MLDAEAEQHDAPGAGLGLDDRRLAGDRLLALEPAAEQDVFRAVGGDDLARRPGGRYAELKAKKPAVSRGIP